MRVHPMREVNKPSRTYRKYDIQFKRHAVNLWLDGDQSAKAVAEEPGIRENLLKLSPSGGCYELEMVSY
jgi:transposase-like protein